MRRQTETWHLLMSNSGNFGYCKLSSNGSNDVYYISDPMKIRCTRNVEILTSANFHCYCVYLLMCDCSQWHNKYFYQMFLFTECCMHIHSADLHVSPKLYAIRYTHTWWGMSFHLMFPVDLHSDHIQWPTSPAYSFDSSDTEQMRLRVWVNGYAHLSNGARLVRTSHARRWVRVVEFTTASAFVASESVIDYHRERETRLSDQHCAVWMERQLSWRTPDKSACLYYCAQNCKIVRVLTSCTVDGFNNELQ